MIVCAMSFNILCLLWFMHGINLATGSCHLSLGPVAFRYMASRRPYFYNASRETENNFTPEGCTPVKLWYYGRHGSRNPGLGELTLMQRLLPTLHAEIKNAIEMGQSKLCEEESNELKAWLPRRDLKFTKAALLLDHGKTELLEIGKRFKKRFPNLFLAHFENSSYLFEHTAYQRTKESAKAFARGLFGAESDFWMPVGVNTNPTLTFFALCPKYFIEVERNSEATIEYTNFVKSEIFNETIADVSSRLGLVRNLTLSELLILYKTCAFETAWKNGSISPWCAIFDGENFERIVYSEDLNYYLRDGYGHEINYEIACPPFKHLLETFDAYIQDPGKNGRKFHGYFSHSEAVLKMLARLGLFASTQPLSNNNYKEQHSYAWKTSEIGSMGTNLAITLFKCSTDYKIGFYFQEVPTALPACGGRAFCTYAEFRKYLAQFTDKCNLTKMCRLNTGNGKSTKIETYLSIPIKSLTFFLTLSLL